MLALRRRKPELGRFRWVPTGRPGFSSTVAPRGGAPPPAPGGALTQPGGQTSRSTMRVPCSGLEPQAARGTRLAALSATYACQGDGRWLAGTTQVPGSRSSHPSKEDRHDPFRSFDSHLDRFPVDSSALRSGPHVGALRVPPQPRCLLRLRHVLRRRSTALSASFALRARSLVFEMTSSKTPSPPGSPGSRPASPRASATRRSSLGS